MKRKATKVSLKGKKERQQEVRWSEMKWVAVARLSSRSSWKLNLRRRSLYIANLESPVRTPWDQWARRDRRRSLKGVCVSSPLPVHCMQQRDQNFWAQKKCQNCPFATERVVCQRIVWLFQLLKGCAMLCLSTLESQSSDRFGSWQPTCLSHLVAFQARNYLKHELVLRILDHPVVL